MPLVNLAEKHYVVFSSPGTFFDEVSRREISSWDVMEAIAKSKTIEERHGALPYGFKFQTYLEKVEPKLLKKSGMYFIGGIVERYDDVVKRNDKSEEILRSNMRYNNMWTIVTSINRYKSVHPFRLDDIVLDKDTGDVLHKGEEFREYHQTMTSIQGQ